MMATGSGSGRGRRRWLGIGGGIALLLLALALLTPPHLRTAVTQKFRAKGQHMAIRLGLVRAGGGVAGAIAFAAVPAAAAGPVPPTRIGINLSPPLYASWRLYANMMVETGWLFQAGGQSQRELTGADLDEGDNPQRVPADAILRHQLATPATGPGGARFRCSYDGQGQVDIGGDITNIVRSPHLTTFRMNTHEAQRSAMVSIQRVEPSDPPRNIDCRESDLDPAARFTPAAIDAIKDFAVIRFMDLQRINANERVTWATRNTPKRTDLTKRDGMAIEDMVRLANEAKVDPWFCIPWNADQDYVTRFARYVHDHLAPGRTAYVELGNEVWNQSFPASQQAKAEGVARKLAPNPDVALAYRYAERTGEVMRLWTTVFADNPRRLVRVIATQHVNPAGAQALLGYRDTARWVDALATAPYFGYQVYDMGTRDPDQLFPKIQATITQAMDRAVQQKAIARSFGKRYITYEGGQHIVFGDDKPLMERMQRDQRMYGLYRAYIGQWRTRVGDVLTLFNSIGGIGAGGAFGMQEYETQPLAAAPKMRAVRDELAGKPAG